MMLPDLTAALPVDFKESNVLASNPSATSSQDTNNEDPATSFALQMSKEARNTPNEDDQILPIAVETIAVKPQQLDEAKLADLLQTFHDLEFKTDSFSMTDEVVTSNIQELNEGLLDEELLDENLEKEVEVILPLVTQPLNQTSNIPLNLELEFGANKENLDIEHVSVGQDLAPELIVASEENLLEAPIAPSVRGRKKFVEDLPAATTFSGEVSENADFDVLEESSGKMVISRPSIASTHVEQNIALDDDISDDEEVSIIDDNNIDKHLGLSFESLVAQDNDGSKNLNSEQAISFKNTLISPPKTTISSEYLVSTSPAATQQNFNVDIQTSDSTCWGQSFAEVVAKQIYPQKIQYATIAINPSHLGPINLEFRLDANNEATINFEVANLETKKLLEQNFNTISQHLQTDTTLNQVNLQFGLAEHYNRPGAIYQNAKNNSQSKLELNNDNEQANLGTRPRASDGKIDIMV